MIAAAIGEWCKKIIKNGGRENKQSLETVLWKLLVFKKIVR